MWIEILFKLEKKNRTRDVTDNVEKKPQRKQWVGKFPNANVSNMQQTNDTIYFQSETIKSFVQHSAEDDGYRSMQIKWRIKWARQRWTK